MNKANVRPIPRDGFFTAWVTDLGIECLIRSADWYKLSPIRRFLYNAAASDIRMEDMKTELRTYTFEDFEELRQYLERCEDFPAETARDAWLFFLNIGDTFGVVHLVQDGPDRGDRIIGDDPSDLAHFIGQEEYEKLIAKIRAMMLRNDESEP